MHPQSELLAHNFFYARNRMTTAKISIRMEIEMHKKRLLTMLLPLFLMIIPFVTYATTITSRTFDKDTYRQGQTGYITVTMYNDEDSKIKVTELTATIDYYSLTETSTYKHSIPMRPCLSKFNKDNQTHGTSRSAYQPTLLRVTLAFM